MGKKQSQRNKRNRLPNQKVKKGRAFWRSQQATAWDVRISYRSASWSPNYYSPFYLPAMLNHLGSKPADGWFLFSLPISLPLCLSKKKKRKNLKESGPIKFCSCDNKAQLCHLPDSCIALERCTNHGGTRTLITKRNVHSRGILCGCLFSKIDEIQTHWLCKTTCAGELINLHEFLQLHLPEKKAEGQNITHFLSTWLFLEMVSAWQTGWECLRVLDWHVKFGQSLSNCWEGSYQANSRKLYYPKKNGQWGERTGFQFTDFKRSYSSRALCSISYMPGSVLRSMYLAGKTWRKPSHNDP